MYQVYTLADVKIDNGDYVHGFPSFLRLVVVYMKKHASGFGTKTPEAYFNEWYVQEDTYLATKPSAMAQ